MAVNAGASGSKGETRVQVASDGSRAAAVQQDGSGRALPGSGERAAGEETLVLPPKMDPAELPSACMLTVRGPYPQNEELCLVRVERPSN